MVRPPLHKENGMLFLYPYFSTKMRNINGFSVSYSVPLWFVIEVYYSFRYS